MWLYMYIYIYHSELYGLSFLDLTDAFFFTRSPSFFVYISSLQVHFDELQIDEVTV